MASFPNSVKTFTTRTNLTDKVDAGHVNDLQDEVNAIETDALAAWVPVAFDAGNFTGSGTIVWTVAAGDQAYFKYRKRGKTLLVSFGFDTTTVAGAGNTLQVPIPGGFTAAAAMDTCVRNIDAGTAGIGYAFVTAGGTTIGFRKADGANWGAGVDTTYVRGQMLIETTT
jgi:hypothetical protein